MQMTRTTKNDNLRMGSRIKRGELVNMWMFGRLTAGTTQGKKRNKINMQVYTFKNEITALAWVMQAHLHGVH